MSQLRIECTAILNTDGKVFTIPRPGRHHDVIRLMVQAGCPKPITGTQGFLASDGKFVEREPAKVIAQQAGQLLPRASNSTELFSEDMW